MFKSTIEPKKFETFIEINNLINSNYSDIRALLTKILESATRLVEGEASSLLLLEKESQKLYFEIALGVKGHDIKNFSLNLGEGIAGWVAGRRTSLICDDVDKDPRFLADISRQIGFPTTSILAVPMCIRDEIVGVIEIINKKSGKHFGQPDLEWLEVFSTQAALAIQNMRSLARAREEIGLLREQLPVEKGFHTFVGKSPAIIEKLELARRVGASDSSVLILGESGTGKELFAEQIHLASPRKKGPFVRVNCAALPEALLESELFGHVKGAFTDATATRRGRFELAGGGTIFLDEIGDLPLSLQAKLLRVLQHKVFERLGSNEPVIADVRIVAATNKNIQQEVEKGSFRSDLYYRLNVLPLSIPPLRQRPEDIAELAEFFLKRFNRETNKKISGFSEAALEALYSYAWPGNVRELENAVERAVVIAGENLIRPQDLLLPTDRGQTGDSYEGKTFREAMQGFKKAFLTAVLKTHNWNQTITARALGLQRTYLTKLIKELGISK
ncbi:MAG: sigma 54-interacting transcriptional regulator [Spirochaetales bacterium]|jgi:Nif-specific regulatory protein|nr:sigma 54-interacting transcriptional regulator [Spirochaetales bacterium]